MPASTKGSPGAGALGIWFGFLALLFWLLALATLADLAGSDPAGNAYAQVYGAFEIIMLWGLLAVIAIIAFVKGAEAQRAGRAHLDPCVRRWALELLSSLRAAISARRAGGIVWA